MQSTSRSLQFQKKQHQESDILALVYLCRDKDLP